MTAYAVELFSTVILVYQRSTYIPTYYSITYKR